MSMIIKVIPRRLTVVRMPLWLTPAIAERSVLLMIALMIPTIIPMIFLTVIILLIILLMILLMIALIIWPTSSVWRMRSIWWTRNVPLGLYLALHDNHYTRMDPETKPTIPDYTNKIIVVVLNNNINLIEYIPRKLICLYQGIAASNKGFYCLCSTKSKV